MRDKQEYRTSIAFSEEILDVIRKDKIVKNSHDYAIILHNLSRYYNYNKDYKLSIKNGVESIALLRNDSIDNTLKGGLCSVIANCYFEEGEFNQALNYSILSYQHFKMAHVIDDRIPSSLSDAIIYGYKAEVYDSLLFYNQLIIDYYSETNNQDVSGYLDFAIIRRPILKTKNGNVNNACLFLSEAIEVFKSRIYDTDEYVFWGIELSETCRACSNYSNSIDILNFLCRQYEIGSLSCMEQYGIVLELIAILFNDINDYDKAISYGEKALETIKKYRNDHEQAIMKHNLAFFYHRKGDYEKAYSLSLDAIKYFRRNNDLQLLTNHLLDYSEMLYKNGKYQEAIQYASEALEISEKINNKSSIVHSLQDISAYYYFMNEFDLSFEYLDKALCLFPNHMLLNNNAALFYFQQKQYDIASKYNATAFTLLKKYLEKTLKEIPIRQWIPFWEEERSYVSNVIHYVIVPNNTIPLYNETAYNALLLRKGFLLNNLRHIKSTINNTENKLYIQIWNEYINEKHSVSNGTSFNVLLSDSIENIITNIYKDNLFSENIEWKDVHNRLKNNEVAIEFFVDYCYKDPIYGALVLKKEFNTPMFVHICTENQIKNYVDSLNYEIYNSYEFGNLIWQKLIKCTGFEKSDIIYFSPDGLLNIIGIENILLNSDIRIGDLYNIHRISSTKFINDRESQDSINNISPILLFGGLNYNSILEKNIDYPIDSLSVNEKDYIRAKFDYLPYSLAEVDSIEKIALRRSLEVDKFIAEKGTEMTFYQSLNKKPSIIHLSTHGYYNLPRKEENDITEGLVRNISYNNNYLNLSLKNTGLLFSSAFDNDSILYSKDTPYNAKDNILTSLELCDLDLSSTELVVMSACQTALGDITPDGIAGLQRGLKYAGAGSIIMSLWKVDDMATSIMMTEFYKELFLMKSKHMAFKHAQQIVKQLFDNPYYWASFIILD